MAENEIQISKEELLRKEERFKTSQDELSKKLITKDKKIKDL